MQTLELEGGRCQEGRERESSTGAPVGFFYPCLHASISRFPFMYLFTY
jgi:hypothetical protein